MNCKKCGGEISEGLNFCPACGEALNASVNEGNVNTFGTEATPKKKSGLSAGSIIKLVLLLAAAAVGIFRLVFVGATPKDLEYKTFTYSDGYGYTFTVEYGYKDDIVYTETDTYTYDLTVGEPWTQEEIDMVVAEYDAYAADGEKLKCYEYSKTVTDTKLEFVDKFTDLGKADNIKQIVYLGWFSFEGGYEEGTLISMEQTETTLLAEGLTEVK